MKKKKRCEIHTHLLPFTLQIKTSNNNNTIIDIVIKPLLFCNSKGETRKGHKEGQLGKGKTEREK